MPLLTCPACAGEVSDAAPACPHCGRPADDLPPTPFTEDDAAFAVASDVAEVDPAPGESACPACGSHDVRRVRRVLEEGATEVSVSGTTSPTAEAMLAGVPTWAADRGISPSGTQRTLPATRLAPPPKPGFARPVVEWFGLTFVFQLGLTLAVQQPQAVRGALMVAALVLPLLLPVLWHRKRKAAWRTGRAEWERSWLCLRCGAAFVQGG